MEKIKSSSLCGAVDEGVKRWTAVFPGVITPFLLIKGPVLWNAFLDFWPSHWNFLSIPVHWRTRLARALPFAWASSLLSSALLIMLSCYKWKHDQLCALAGARALSLPCVHPLYFFALWDVQILRNEGTLGPVCSAWEPHLNEFTCTYMIREFVLYYDIPGLSAITWHLCLCSSRC